MYHSTITVSDDIEGLERLFSAEEKDLGRASYDVARHAGKLIITINAQDATALKVALSTINKILIIWEKSRSVVDSLIKEQKNG